MLLFLITPSLCTSASCVHGFPSTGVNCSTPPLPGPILLSFSCFFLLMSASSYGGCLALHLLSIFPLSVHLVFCLFLHDKFLPIRVRQLPCSPHARPPPSPSSPFFSPPTPITLFQLTVTAFYVRCFGFQFLSLVSPLGAHFQLTGMFPSGIFGVSICRLESPCFSSFCSVLVFLLSFFLPIFSLRFRPLFSANVESRHPVFHMLSPPQRRMAFFSASQFPTLSFIPLFLLLFHSVDALCLCCPSLVLQGCLLLPSTFSFPFFFTLELCIVGSLAFQILVLSPFSRPDVCHSSGMWRASFPFLRATLQMHSFLLVLFRSSRVFFCPRILCLLPF